MKSSILSSISYGVAGGGTIDGDLTISGDLTVSGSATYTYDEQVDGQVWIKDSTASSATQGGHLRLFSDDGAVMASGHRLGVIEFGGAEDTSSTITVGARIEAITDATWSASENGAYLSFYTTDGNASQTERLRIDNNSRVSLSNNDSGGTGGMDDTTGNTILGYTAGNTLGAGCVNNVIIGHSAGMDADTTTTDAVANVYIGVMSGQNMDDGINNVAVGFKALRATAADGNDAANNVAIGYQALLSVTDGDDNVAIGSGSGDAITDSAGNVLIGKNSGGALAAGSNYNVMIGDAAGNTDTNNLQKCVFVGRKAGYDMTGGVGDGSVLIGASAGENLTGALQSTAIGFEALLANLVGDQNTAVGYTALRGCVGADEEQANVAVGREAGYGIVAGRFNVCVGNKTMQGLDHADTDNNVAVGHEAMKGGTDAGAASNVAVGYQSLLSITGGDNNIAIGHSAGDAITTGSSNVIMGFNAGGGTTDVDGTVIIGYGAGQANMTSTDDYNIYIGYEAGKDVIVGHHGQKNILIGYHAGYALTKGDGNTVVGFDALKDTTKANFNTAIGYQALTSMNQSIDTDAYNTAVGNDAGKAINSGIGNTIVGALGGDAITSGSNNTVMGYDVDADTATTNNQTVLGSSGVFKLLSKEYTCDHSDDTDLTASSSEASPLKLPAYSIIKSISAIITQKSNKTSAFNVAIYHSDDTASPADNVALGGTPVELIGAGAATSKAGNSASAVDINLRNDSGIEKLSFYNGFDGNGLHIGTAPRYIHIANAGTGNGTTDPSTVGLIKILVEYVGLD